MGGWEVGERTCGKGGLQKKRRNFWPEKEEGNERGMRAQFFSGVSLTSSQLGPIKHSQAQPR